VTPSKDHPANHRPQGRMQAKDIRNILNKIVEEIFPNLKKERHTQVQEASRTPRRHDQNRTSPWHVIVKMINMENKERILKTVREKKQITHKGKPIKIQ
jgi:hypothetical protein